jgi:hypothetical protein
MPKKLRGWLMAARKLRPARVLHPLDEVEERWQRSRRREETERGQCVQWP